MKKTIYVVNNPGYGDGPIMEAFVNKKDAEKVADKWTNDDVDDLEYFVTEVTLHPEGDNEAD